MCRLLCANTFNNNGRKTKAVNYCESRDPDDGETLYIIYIILVRLFFVCFNKRYSFKICL